MIKHTLLQFLLVSCLLVTSSAHAGKPPIYSGGKQRAAIKGYDPVAYFIENKAVKGSKDFAYKYNGAKWLFSSKANMQTFINNPEKYSPQYGGYCAYAVAQDTTAAIKPEYFNIHEGKLYLNYSKSVYKKWIKDKEEYIENANENWPDLVDHSDK